MNDPCEKMQDTIIDCILGALNRQEIDALQKHLSWCSQCRKNTQALRDQSRLLGRLAGQLDADVTAREDSTIEALNRLALTEQGSSDSVWGAIIKNRVTRIAAAAVIIITALIGVSVFTGPRERPVRDVVKQTATDEAKVKWEARLAAEAEKIRQMAAVDDIEGLIAMLSEGLYDSKILAAYYLGKIGDMRAISTLAMFSQQWQGDELEDPFAAASEEILGRLAVEQSSSEAEPDIIMEETDAVAEAQRTFTLLVVNEQTKEPIPDVKLFVKLDGDKGWDETDKSGRCVISLPEKEVRSLIIEAREEGFIPAAFFYNRKEALKELPENYTLFLRSGVSIGGFVRNTEGQPIEGAIVRPRLPGSEIVRAAGIGETQLLKHVPNIKTDVNGFWRYDGMVGDIKKIWIRCLIHPDYIDIIDVTGTEQEPTTEELLNMTSVMVMSKGFDISGYVLDMNGQPVKGARVLKGPERFIPGYLRKKTYTDDEGKFRFINARGGRMTLTVQTDGFAPALKQIIVHGQTPPVEFRLEPGTTIRGQIVDLEDRPIEGALVTANRWRGYRSIDWRAKTDAEGYFEWNNAPEDEVLFNVSKEGYMSVCDSNKSVIKMYHPLRISGKVTDAETGEPINNFKLIHMVDWGSTPPLDPLSGKPDSEEHPSFYPFTFGQYELIFDHPANKYSFRIEADDYTPAISRTFTSDEGNVVFDFELQKGTGPSGTVYLPDDLPAADAQVILCSPSQSASIRNGSIVEEMRTQFIETKSDGRFSFHARAETYLLAVLADQGYAEIMSQRLQTEPNVIIEPWGRVEGTLYIGSEPTAGKEVFLNYTQRDKSNALLFDYEYTAETDANGEFVFDWVPPRRVRVGRLLRLSSQITSYSHAANVDIESGQTVNITIGGTGRPVIGKVTVPADYEAPVDFSCAYNSIYHRPPESQSAEVTEQRSYAFKINPDGSFRIDDIPAGSYNLQISLHERLQNRDGSRGECIGQINYDFVIPKMADGFSDEPFDIGTLELEMK